MHVTKVGKIYKVARITGPQHHFLGLALTEDAVPSLTVERLQVGEAVTPTRALDEPRLLAAVHQGIADANQQLGTHFQAEKSGSDSHRTRIETCIAHRTHIQQ